MPYFSYCQTKMTVFENNLFSFICQNLDPCEGICDETEKCYLRNGVPVCKSRQGLCWAWGGEHYHTFDGFNFNFEGTCTYLLASSKGVACSLTPFSLSMKNGCNDSRATSCKKAVTLQAYGLIIRLGSENGSILVSSCCCCCCC